MGFFSGMFTIIGGFVGIITIIVLILLFTSMGFSKFLSFMKKWFNDFFKGKSGEETIIIKSDDSSITFTKQRCERCGTTYIGTTQDPDNFHLHKVAFMNNTKNMCTKCRDEVIFNYCKVDNDNDEVVYSPLAKDLLTVKENKKKKKTVVNLNKDFSTNGRNIISSLRKGCSTVAEIASDMNFNSDSVRNLLNELIEKGVVEKTITPNDTVKYVIRKDVDISG